MSKSENIIYFFSALGFFSGLIFSIINFSQPEEILLCTFAITLVFYALIHTILMSFSSSNHSHKEVFNIRDHEVIEAYFTDELDRKEQLMDRLLGSIHAMNQQYENLMKGTMQSHESHHKQSA